MGFYQVDGFGVEQDAEDEYPAQGHQTREHPDKNRGKFKKEVETVRLRLLDSQERVLRPLDHRNRRVRIATGPEKIQE